jgi:hypothetical protein
MKAEKSHSPDFLLYCSGVSREILDRCPESEVRKYRLLGLAVLIPAILGVFSGGYAVYTTFQSLTAAVAIGLLWGFVVLTIDRVLVLTYRNKEHAAQNLVNPGLWLRIGLATIIALTIAKPIELRLFKGSVDEQITKTTEARIASETEVYYDAMDSIRQSIVADDEKLELGLAAVDRELLLERDKVERLRAGFIEEMDGSGGTLKRGIGPIATQKRMQLERAEEDLWLIEEEARQEKLNLKEEQIALTAQRRREIRNLQIKADKRGEEITAVASSDLLARLDALSDLGKENPPIKYASLLLTFLFLFIELVPLLAKAFIRDGAYAFYLENEEKWFRRRSGLDIELDQKTMEVAQSFESRKKEDEKILDMRLDMLERQVNHSSDYFRLERRFAEMLELRANELEDSPYAEDFEAHRERLKKEFLDLAALNRLDLRETDEEKDWIRDASERTESAKTNTTADTAPAFAMPTAQPTAASVSGSDVETEPGDETGAVSS